MIYFLCEHEDKSFCDLNAATIYNLGQKSNLLLIPVPSGIKTNGMSETFALKMVPKLSTSTGLDTLAQAIGGMVAFVKKYTTQHP